MAEPFDTIEAYRALDRFGAAEIERLKILSEEYPACAELWDFLGDVMQICEEDGYTIQNAIDCYHQALAVDPEYATAHESLGYAYDTYFDDFARAEIHFRHAIENGAGDSSRIGLARVLAQLGRIADAYSTIDRCNDADDDACVALRREIAEGIWYDSDQ